jgi:hypothetical protein
MNQLLGYQDPIIIKLELKKRLFINLIKTLKGQKIIFIIIYVIISLSSST